MRTTRSSIATAMRDEKTIAEGNDVGGLLRRRRRGCGRRSAVATLKKSCSFAAKTPALLALLLVILLLKGCDSFVVRPATTTCRLASPANNKQPQLLLETKSVGNANVPAAAAAATATSLPMKMGFFGRNEAPTSSSSSATKAKADSEVNRSASHTLLTNLLGDRRSPADKQGSGADGGNAPSMSITELRSYVAPVTDVLDEYTDGWALSYADLYPDGPQTPAGVAFLATNLFYAAAGLVLTFGVGDSFLGFLTDLAAICSYNYHYQQLQSCTVGQDDHGARAEIQSLVKLSLLLDYAVAGATILTAFGYLLSSEATSLQHHLSGLPTEEIAQALQIGMVGVAFLALSWKYEKGRPYMFFHSLWHLFSAYAGYLIGTAHFNVEAMAASTSASPLLDVLMEILSGRSG